MIARKMLGIVFVVVLIAGLVIGTDANMTLAGAQLSNFFNYIHTHGPQRPVELQCIRDNATNEAYVTGSLQNVDRVAYVQFKFTGEYGSNRTFCEQSLHLQAGERVTLECTIPLSALSDERPEIFVRGDSSLDENQWQYLPNSFGGMCVVLPDIKPLSKPLMISLVMMVSGSVGWLIIQRPTKLNFWIGIIGASAIVTGICSLVLWFVPMQLIAIVIAVFMPYAIAAVLLGRWLIYATKQLFC